VTGYAINLTPRRVVIASDTAVFLPDRPPRLIGFTSKVRPLAHLRAAIFARGMLKIARLAISMLELMPELATIEGVAEAMQRTLQIATERYCIDYGIDDPAEYLLAEVYLVGWSESARRMRLWYWANTDGYEPRHDGGTLYRTISIPQLPDAEMPARRGTLEAQLVSVMKAVRRFYEAHPALGMIGGEVELWSISRAWISMRSAHRFPDALPARSGELLASADHVDIKKRLFTAAEMPEAALAGPKAVAVAQCVMGTV
jgi:hypothetical protein